MSRPDPRPDDVQNVFEELGRISFAEHSLQSLVQHVTDVAARLVIYRAFIESDLEVPKHLARPVHDLYFNPQHEEFQSRTLWSLSNAFTSAFKQLEPIPQFKATAKLAGFLQAAV